MQEEDLLSNTIQNYIIEIYWFIDLVWKLNRHCQSKKCDGTEEKNITP